MTNQCWGPYGPYHTTIHEDTLGYQQPYGSSAFPSSYPTPNITLFLVYQKSKVLRKISLWKESITQLHYETASCICTIFLTNVLTINKALPTQHVLIGIVFQPISIPCPTQTRTQNPTVLCTALVPNLKTASTDSHRLSNSGSTLLPPLLMETAVMIRLYSTDVIHS